MRKKRGLIFGVFLLALFGLLGTVSATTAFSNFTATSSIYNIIPKGLGITSATVTTPNQTWLDFDGVDDLLVAKTKSNLYLPNSSNFSYTFDFYQQSVSDYYYNGSAFFGDYSGTNKCGFQIVRGTTAGNRLDISLGNGTGVNTGNIVGFSKYGVWSSIGGSFNDTEGKISTYFDGYYNSSSPARPNFVSCENSLNYGEAGGVYYNGSLDKLALYDKILRADQFLTIEGYDGGFLNRLTNMDYCQNTYRGLMWYNSTGSVTLFAGNKTRVSTDDCVTFGGAKWEFPVDATGRSPYGLWQDSRDTMFVSFEQDNGRIWMSMGNDTNWTNPMNMSCSNGTLWTPMGITEMSDGTLFMGQYETEDSSSECAVIYKSEDGGLTWTVSYNSSAVDSIPSRHIHFVQADPYTNYIYASMGDGETERKIIRSVDNGTTWTTLFSGNTQSLSTQPTSIIFTSEYRIFGEDHTPEGDSYSRIFRTSDDVNLDIVFNRGKKWEGAWYWGQKDNNGIIYFGMQETDAGNKNIIVASEDNGTSWYPVKVYNDTMSQGGTYSPSNVNSLNEFIVHGLGTENNIRISDDGNHLIYYFKLNENTGTTAYDSSGNGNNGTISGATWQTDGQNVTYVSGIDYLLNGNTGVLTLLGTDKLYSFVQISWDYLNAEDGMHFFTDAGNLIFLIIPIVALLGVYVLAKLFWEGKITKEDCFAGIIGMLFAMIIIGAFVEIML